MQKGWRFWGWAHVAVLIVGIVVGKIVDWPLVAWWLVFVILGAVFTIQMTRQALDMDRNLASHDRVEWDRRLIWLGPLAILWLLVAGAEDVDHW